MWEGFTSGLSNLAGSIGTGMENMFNLGNTGLNNMASSLQGLTPEQYANLDFSGYDAGSLGTSSGNLFGGFGNMMTGKTGTGLLGAGVQGFNALNNYNMGNKQMDLANRGMNMQEDAYQTDKANAEARKNLRF